MPGPSETKEVLIVVRTYPTPARTGVEVSCTAGITRDGKWVRLFPIPYRSLRDEQQFSKYQWVEASVRRPRGDSRPESYRVERDSIRIISEPLSTTREWQERKNHVLPLRSPSLCWLKRERDSKKHPTLGIFRPKVIDELTIEAAAAEWSQAQLDILRQAQGTLFQSDPAPAIQLEKLPYDFRYRFRCEDDRCNGHQIICTDWEMGQAWRSWRDAYGDGGWEQKFRQRFETEMIEKNDTHFYVGTVHHHPSIWIIVGLFYPPKTRQAGLFEEG